MPDTPPNEKKPQGYTIGSLIGGAIDQAVGSVGTVGRFFGSAMQQLPGLGASKTPGKRFNPGSRPGIENALNVNTPPPPGTVFIQCIDYGPDRVVTTDVDDIESFLAQPRPDWVSVRWLNIDGLHPYVINKVRAATGMHTLAAEDVVHVPQRPRAEPYDKDLFIIARMMRLVEDKLLSEQVSLFLGQGLVVTFQESHGDVWQPIRDRINTEGTRLRKHGPSYLVYALLDAAVDHCFPILERYGDLLEDLETKVLDSPDAKALARIHAIKRELSVLRRVMWPMREVIASIRETEMPIVSKNTRTYLRDVYEHTVQIVEIIETFREMGSSLTDLHMSAVGNRMNETMKVLTIMASLFIPITFLAGVYGMNFDYIPGIHWGHAFVIFMGACVVTVAGMLWYFYRKGWIGNG